MMQSPGLEAESCPNWETCGRAQSYDTEEEIELLRSLGGEVRPLRLSRYGLALLMLRLRGCHQTVESFGLESDLEEMAALSEALLQTVADYDDGYIAPEGVEAHRYNVKRPSFGWNEQGERVPIRKVYWYNKLMATQTVFEPSEERRPVRMIHLSKDEDPRNIEGRLGIERRNRLQQIQTRVQAAKALLEEAHDIAIAPMDNVLAE
ncbi:MAG: hypothetical protein AAF329_04225 [Cyanobacteria bacterium P01_A01_bin.17]